MAELKNVFSWSKSRDEIFLNCRRKYFYNYYGSWGGWKEGAKGRTRQIYVLKNLQSRHMWLGSVVHEQIESLLNKARYNLDMDLYTLCGNLRKAMNQDFKNSRRGLYIKYPKIYGRQYGLFEHEYNVFVSDEQWKEIFDNAQVCVNNFFNSDLLRHIQSIDRDRWLPIEKLQTFDFEGTRVYVKIDFAMKDGGKLFIFDWKTGKVRHIEMDVQLACYGLYCGEKWGYAPRDILCRKYNLLIDKVDDYDLNDGRIEGIMEYMRDSIGSMRELLHDSENNIAREVDFDMTSDDSRCRTCNFKKICPRWD